MMKRLSQTPPNILSLTPSLQEGRSSGLAHRRFHERCETIYFFLPITVTKPQVKKFSVCTDRYREIEKERKKERQTERQTGIKTDREETKKKDKQI